MVCGSLVREARAAHLGWPRASVNNCDRDGAKWTDKERLLESCRKLSASILSNRCEVTLYGDDNRGICPWSYRSKRDLHVDGATRKGDIYLP
jgi:hypothetical protein